MNRLFTLVVLSILGFASAFASTDCSKELLLAYFPEPFVTETLSRFNVPKEQWGAINKELSQKDEEVIRMVESKASKMTPNPMQDPKLRQQAVKLFRETLLQIFSDVMYAHGVTDTKQIQSMLDDIQQQKAERFAQCMKTQRIREKQSSVTEQEDDFSFEE